MMKKRSKTHLHKYVHKNEMHKALIWLCDYFRKYVYALYVCLLFKYIFTMFKYIFYYV